MAEEYFRYQKPPSKLVLFVLAFFIIITVTGIFVEFYSEYLWFGEVGYQSVFLKTLYAKILTGAAAGLFCFFFLLVNIIIARRMAPVVREAAGFELMEKIRTGIQSALRFGAPAIAVVVSLIAVLVSWSYWDTVLRFLEAVRFGIADPEFGLDVGFYVFALPFYENLCAYLYGVLFVTLILVTVIHFLDGAINFTLAGERFAPHVKGHISTLLGLLFILQAWRYKLGIYNLMYSPRGAAFGASYTDIHAQMPANNILIVVALFCAGLFFVNIYFRGWKLPAAGIFILVIASFVFGTAYPALVQQYRVAPNEIEREKKYLANNIEFTRLAYNLGKVKEVNFPANEELSQEELKESETTLKSIRLWDWRPLKETYSQIQAIRLYYSFMDVDVDRYMVDGEYRQILISVRELDKNQLQTKAKTWVNNHLVYTHGFGVCVSPVNEFTPEGLPKFFVKDIPPVVSKKEFQLERPEIYFGEAPMNDYDYIFVRTRTKEFNYPEGDKNAYTVYSGKGGIKLDNFFKKLLFAYRFGTLQMLLSDSLTPESRIIIHTGLKERIRNVAPFLAFDSDPYPVINDGRIYWIVDAYTTSGQFPYSEPYRDIEGREYGFNYIRNSVKVIVDAYNGSIDFYLTPDKDPVIDTWKKIFPGIFKEFSELPEAFKKHLRYPEDIFSIQTNMYRTYHMTDPQVFYNKEDLWEVADEVFGSGEGDYGNRRQKTEPYYITFKLPGAEKEQFVMMLPFTPTNKNNMVAWFAANSDFPGYGDLLVYKFPKARTVYGPMQVEARIDQDSEISKLLTLWGQKGSSVIRGNLLVIPVGDSIIYVEPIYLQAEESQLPELKKIILSYGSKILISDNLEQALAELFGTPAPGTAVPEKPPAEEGTPEAGKPEVPLAKSVNELILEASGHYEKMTEAMQEADWETYGKELKSLEESLKKLKEQAGGEE